jgi:amino-acid N-acetyltransferase
MARKAKSRSATSAAKRQTAQKSRSTTGQKAAAPVKQKTVPVAVVEEERSTAVQEVMLTEPSSTGILVREAMREDIPELEEFVERFVQANRLLPRTTEELYDLIPFGFVAIADNRLVGFAALEIYSAKLAEVRSLAVHEDYQGRGVGRGLVERCVDLAQRRNILEVMAITSSDGFFRACGFDFTLPGEKKALFMQTREKY